MNFPAGSKELIDELARMFPERLPEAGEDPAVTQRHAGKREVVLFLIHWRDAAVRSAVREPRKRSR